MNFCCGVFFSDHSVRKKHGWIPMVSPVYGSGSHISRFLGWECGSQHLPRATVGVGGKRMDSCCSVFPLVPLVG